MLPELNNAKILHKEKAMTCKVLHKKGITFDANRTRTHVLSVGRLAHHATDVQNEPANLHIIINKKKKKSDAPSSSNDGNLNERMSAIPEFALGT